jgi:1,4-dihydroxy-2-naphthoate octaprenyltransferase
MSIAGVTTFLLMLIISISILVSSGVWNKMMDIVKNMDPNQQVSVSEIQQELMDEVLAGYDVQRT